MSIRYNNKTYILKTVTAIDLMFGGIFMYTGIGSINFMAIYFSKWLIGAHFKTNCVLRCFISRVSNTVKFLIVAASPIEAAPQTLKTSLFLQKFPNLKTSRKPQGDF